MTNIEVGPPNTVVRCSVRHSAVELLRALDWTAHLSSGGHNLNLGSA
ncbi:MAG: hypothetical protein WBA10_17185 [Elainellaceae cyanobacterium]